MKFPDTQIHELTPSTYYLLVHLLTCFCKERDDPDLEYDNLTMVCVCVVERSSKRAQGGRGTMIDE